MTNKTISVDALLDEIDKHGKLVTEGVKMDGVANAYLAAHDHIKLLVQRMDPIGRATAVKKHSTVTGNDYCGACGCSMVHKYCANCGARMDGEENG